MLETREHPSSMPVSFVQGEMAGVDQNIAQSSQKFAERVNAAEWLGPLAPIALSPFFGMTCLSGIATYGPQWLKDRSQMFGDTNGLNNPVLFWTMLTLTILTSLPRFSKVSKPISLAAEKLEAYSVVVILIATRILVGYAATPDGAATEASLSGDPELLLAGFGSIPIDVAMAIAAGLNIIVINSVKLFVEFLVWLTPVPMIDAMLEIFHKGACAGLIAVYCWSPLLATVINLALLVVCSSVFFWTRRRIVYYFHALLVPALLFLFRLGKPKPVEVEDLHGSRLVFLAKRTNGFPKLTKMHLSGSSHQGWMLVTRSWIGSHQIVLGDCRLSAEDGLFATTIVIERDTEEPIHLYQPRSDVFNVQSLKSSPQFQPQSIHWLRNPFA